MTEGLYLRENVQVEPLIDRWHAHGYLVPPHTSALYLYRQLQIMDSYVRMPAAHAAALSNPAMQGGEFIDYGGQRVEEIRALRERLIASNAELLQLREALVQLDAIVSASGPTGVRGLYAEMPERLHGFVELVYDLWHRPSFRLIEPLLYASSYFDRRRQQLCLSLVMSDERPFIFGTPRLEESDKIMVCASFDSPSVDEIHSLKYRSATLDEIKALLGVAAEQEQLLTSFLTSEAGRCAERFGGAGLRVRYFGHACLLFETADSCVLVDPLISYPYETPLERFTLRDLPERIDAVVLTHAHHDHLVIEQLLALRGRIGKLVVPRATGGGVQDPSLRGILTNIGFRNVEELAEFDTFQVGGVRITALPFVGEHCDLDIRAKMTLHLRYSSTTCLVAADCDVLDVAMFERARKISGPADLLFISQEAVGAPMAWAYGPLFLKSLPREISDSRRSRGPDAGAALALSRAFDARGIYLYAMGTEPWLQYLMGLHDKHIATSDTETSALIADAKASGLHAEKLHVKAEITVP